MEPESIPSGELRQSSSLDQYPTHQASHSRGEHCLPNMDYNMLAMTKLWALAYAHRR